MSSKTALKALDGTSSPVHATTWDLPTRNADGTWTAGKWARVAGKIEYRRNGLHVCGMEQISFWRGHLRGRDLQVYVVEYSGHTSIGPHGFAVRTARLLRAWDGVEEV